MPLLFPEGHPGSEGPRNSLGSAVTPLRIGIINIMPKLETYEPLLLGPLARVDRVIEPVFLRLESHDYTSSDHRHLGRFYRPFSDAIADGPLDGLMLSGAPVEELAFDDVHYWPELTEILGYARKRIPSTLGLCWGGLALGAMLDIPKIILPKKLFGVFENRVLDTSDPIVAGQDHSFLCAHSRHSSIDDAELEKAAKDGRVRLLSHAEETGYSLFASHDHRFVMHLGHPEYVAERIAFEWNRDRALGRDDVTAPRNFDAAAPSTSWLSHREALFKSWSDWLVAEKSTAL